MDYLPRTESNLVTWATSLAQKLPTHADPLGLTPDDLQGVAQDAALLNYLINTVIPSLQAKVKEFVAYKNWVKEATPGSAFSPLPQLSPLPDPPTAVDPGIVDRLRALVRRIKAAPGYTDAIGQDLSIVTQTDTEDSGKPTFKAIPQPNHEVRLDFVKQSFDGVAIESRYSGETTWTYLGTDRYSPYLDSRPPQSPGKPEVREYRLRYLKRDDQVGEWSDVVIVSTVS